VDCIAGHPRVGCRGHTLIEAIIALGLIGTVTAAAVTASGTLDRLALSRAARIVERQLGGARLRAAARREPIRVRGLADTLVVTAAGGSMLWRMRLGGRGIGAIDSVRVRPSWIRYNPRGHGSAGSVTLYRGRHGVQVVSNFVGRIRRHRFTF
jgi:Tfp pilus assembly protein FimT